jgi:hypothetical protein
MKKFKLSKKVGINTKTPPFHQPFPHSPLMEKEGFSEPDADISELTVLKIIDFPLRKMVYAEIAELSTPIVLWRDKAYDEIGQWTDEQADKILTELIGVLSEEDVLKLLNPRNREILTVAEIERAKAEKIPAGLFFLPRKMPFFLNVEKRSSEA